MHAVEIIDFYRAFLEKIMTTEKDATTTSSESDKSNAIAGTREARFRRYMLYTLLNKKEFLSIDEYEPRDDLSGLVRELLPNDWRVIKRGVWTQWMGPNPITRAQGWKIHVSGLTTNLDQILTVVADVCFSQGTSFKHASDGFIHSLMNSKIWDRGAAGKFVTIYPQDNTVFKSIISQLYDRLKGFDGPYILSDKRYKDSKILYYRYGGFQLINELRANGTQIPSIYKPDGLLVADERTPYFNPPAWESDPFTEEDIDEEDTPLNSRYVLKYALGFSNSGGVYLADDLLNNCEVVIKEARPWTCQDGLGGDSISSLKKEFRMLQKLSGAKCSPKPIDDFIEWEHYFIVQEKIDGMTLHEYMIKHNPFLLFNPSRAQIDNWISQFVALNGKIYRALNEMHAHDIIFGDISPRNIIITDDQNIIFIDYEGAIDINLDEVALTATPGFVRSDRKNSNKPERHDDLYGLVMLMIYQIWPLTPIADLSVETMHRILKSVTKQHSLPNGITNCLIELTKPGRTLEDFKSHFDMLFESNSNECFVARSVHDTSVTENSLYLINDIYSCLEEAIRPRGNRELLPSVPWATNTLSVDYGLAGIIHSYHVIGRPIPSTIQDWFGESIRHMERIPPGLYNGMAGIGLVAYEIGLDDLAYRMISKAFEHPLLYQNSAAYYGAAGVGESLLKLFQYTQEERYLDYALSIATVLSKKAECAEGRSYWPDEDGKINIGAPHGAAGIGKFIAAVGIECERQDLIAIGHSALDHDLKFMINVKGEYYTFPESSERMTVGMPYWLHGSAGMISTLCWFYNQFKDNQHMEVIKVCAPDISRTFAMYPTLFMGLSGFANTLMDIYEVTGELQWRTEAQKVVQRVSEFHIRQETGVGFPSETLLRMSFDLGSGSTGIATAIMRAYKESANPHFI